MKNKWKKSSALLAVLCMVVLLCTMFTGCGAVALVQGMAQDIVGGLGNALGLVAATPTPAPTTTPAPAVTPPPAATPLPAATPTPAVTPTPDTNHWQALEAVRGHWFHHIDSGDDNIIVTQYVIISGSGTNYTVDLAHYASEGRGRGAVHNITQEPDGSYLLRFGDDQQAYFTTDDGGSLLFTFEGADGGYSRFYYAGASDEEARQSWSDHYS